MEWNGMPWQWSMTIMQIIRWTSIVSFVTNLIVIIYSLLPLSSDCSSRAGRSSAFFIKAKDGELAPFSITPEQWGNFLCTIFDEWVLNDVGNYYIQLFDSTLANWVGQQPGVCSLAKYCGHAAVMEFNGDVYACDHFVFPEYKLGNIYQKTLVEMMYGKEQETFV